MCGLTFVLLRSPFVPSIQMYSASALPFWSRAIYFANWREKVSQTLSRIEDHDRRGGGSVRLTLAALDTMVDSPTPAA